jgi:hypothetical protein
MEEYNKNVISYSVETYALFKNVDRTILDTNIFIEPLGYEFICIKLSQLEQYFSSLFAIPKNFQSKMTLLLDDDGDSISNEFSEVIKSNNAFGYSVIMKNEVFLLKKTGDFEQTIVDNKISMSHDGMKALHETDKFVKDLIQQFRLFKNGDISSPMVFQISKKDRHLHASMSDPYHKDSDIFSLTELDIVTLANTFSNVFKINPLTELAISSFNLAYKSTDIRSRYITLMICLESLFNQGIDQISHTISRHLAVIVSSSRDDFFSHYAKIKKLYSLRSQIIHGQKDVKAIKKETDELQDYVRLAINYCLKVDLDRKELFERLNVIGFHE